MYLNGKNIYLSFLKGDKGNTGDKGDTGEKGKRGIGVFYSENASEGQWIGCNDILPNNDSVGASVNDMILNKNGDLFLVTEYTANVDLVEPYSLKVGNVIANIKGAKGDAGTFAISKVYASVAEMDAGYSTDGLPVGALVVIETGNVEDADNAKLYVKGSAAYEFLADMSGATGIQGPRGDKGVSVYYGGNVEQTESGAFITNIYPSTSNPTSGDMILTSTGDIYEVIEMGIDGYGEIGVQAGNVITNIKGEKGEKGDTGEKGERGEAGSPTPYMHARVKTCIQGEKKWLSGLWTKGILTFPEPRDIWTDGENLYYSNKETQLIFDRETSKWENKIWNVAIEHGQDIWHGRQDKVFYSAGTTHYELDKTTLTWNVVNWTGYLSDFKGRHVFNDGGNYIFHANGVEGSKECELSGLYHWGYSWWNGTLEDLDCTYVWTDGENIYYSKGTIHYKLNKDTRTWSVKFWNGLQNFVGYLIWTDGENSYYSDGSSQHVLDKTTSTWTFKTFINGTTGNSFGFSGTSIVKDGENIYLMATSCRYVLDKTTSTWNVVSWGGTGNFTPINIWTDGVNIYFSSNSCHRVLNKGNLIWEIKEWHGFKNFEGSNIWHDGDHIYYSVNTTHYELDKTTSTWSIKTWNGLASFSGENVWTDGENVYYTANSTTYVLDRATSTWSVKTWNGENNINYAYHIWTDGTDIYYAGKYKLNKETSTWETHQISGISTYIARSIWTDGTNIYFSNGSQQFVFDKANLTWLPKTWNGLTNFAGNDLWTDGTNIYYQNTHVLSSACYPQLSCGYLR